MVMPAPFTMILLFATSDSNTGMPSDWSVASITMNGFLPATASASARCAASSLPDDSWNSSSTVRPQVWYAPLFDRDGVEVAERVLPGAPLTRDLIDRKRTAARLLRRFLFRVRREHEHFHRSSR